ncbi:MAG: hypothetical protein ACRC0L_05570, partial [Angustibacter sp.]
YLSGINGSTIILLILSAGALITSLVQAILMVIRSGVLVILAGTLPLSAAATNTETGRNMFRKTTGWILAFILYKPAAALIYAAAFKLASTDPGSDNGLIRSITGLTLMVTSILALPALLKLIIPAVGNVAGGTALGSEAVKRSLEAAPTGAKPRSAPRGNPSRAAGLGRLSPRGGGKFGSFGGSPSGAMVGGGSGGAEGAAKSVAGGTAAGAKVGSLAGPKGAAAGAALGASLGAGRAALVATKTTVNEGVGR